MLPQFYFHSYFNLSNVGGHLWWSYQKRQKNCSLWGSHYCCHCNCVSLHFLMPAVDYTDHFIQKREPVTFRNSKHSFHEVVAYERCPLIEVRLYFITDRP